MAKPKKSRFSFAAKEPLKLASSGADTKALQSLLIRFGYLRGSFEPDHFCKPTERAVRRFQRFYGLKCDGIVGPVTKALMEMSRCGVPDIPVNPGGETAAAPFVLRGCSYPRNDLTFTFLNGTPDLAGGREKEIVRQAFQAWEGVANLRFSEVRPNQNPDFRIAWRSGNHGDGDGFDGPSNVLAHAFFPPPCGGPNAGDMHFDEAETWIDDPTGNGILLLQVAIHEIGHLLGLSHSQDQSAIMFAFYAPDRVNLTQDDIDGVTTLYGLPSTVSSLDLSGNAAGTLLRGGDQDIFKLQVPQTLAIVLDGPDDTDFDLYVRKGAAPTEDEWDWRAFSVSSDERILVPADPSETYFVMVRSFDGSGDYTLRVESA